ncbi:hypothetical protein GIB67_021710 [Kingdonia uniflora]|uniref:Uncharacterized protein n=1 Tax=Kingdonia uniflora TaxID=39325 RepID=A0A7J7LMF3_9MAGN|nr:hypothetical protein GIB67_021710 [Kingdonia uniflora]
MIEYLFVNKREHRNANLRWLYDESDIICHNMLRMNKACFISFCDRLRGKGMRASKHLDVEEQVAIFLLIVGHDTRFRHAQASTMRSLETISKYFHVVLKYVLRLGKDLIKHATPDLSLANRNNYHAWANTNFKDCVGAVDGTFIPATVPLEDQPSLDICGWEGSAHDNRILRAAVNDGMYPFTVPREVDPHDNLEDPNAEEDEHGEMPHEEIGSLRGTEALSNFRDHLCANMWLEYVNSGVMARYYVVFVGRVPGVYETWEETHPQVSGFRGAVHRRVNSRAEADRLFAAFIEKERHVQGGVALEEEEAPPVVEVEEAEDVEDLGGMAVRDVYGWIFCVVLACVGVVCCKVGNK